MTRKKQGAPQRLNSQNGDEVSDTLDSPATIDDVNCMSRDSDDIATSTASNLNHNVEKNDETTVMNSCQKLLEFAQNFLPVNETAGKTTTASIKQEIPAHQALLISQAGQLSDKQSTSNSSDSSPIAVTSQQSYQTESPNFQTAANQEKFHTQPSKQDENEQMKGSLSRPPLATESPSTVGEAADQVDRAADPDSLNAAQKLLMEAMMNQQKQFYEQCTNNWMSVQRCDNNCMSKSKAERYRWCVQGGENQPKVPKSSSSSQSHVTNLKKSAIMAGSGVTPLQDKLYSTVLNGASKFCCRDCGSPFNTLVDLTIHMNKTGHFRDTNGEEQVAVGEKQDERKSSETSKMKKRPLIEDESQSEKVLTCMGCGHLFESLQDLSVHMIKTKHYENVPSLRMWSQKQGSAGESPTSTRKRSLPSSMHFGKKTDVSPATSDPSKLSRSSLFAPPLFGGMNTPAAAAYTNLLLSSPWFASAIPNTMLPSLFASSSGFPYNFGFPPGVFPGSYHNLSIPSSKDMHDNLPATCTQCKESFSSWQKLIEHIHETSHFPNFDPPWLGFPGFSNFPPSSLSSSSPSCSRAGESINNHDSSSKTTLTAPLKPPAEKISPKTAPAAPRHCKDEKSTGTFDFIRSIESTIKAAISKVESPHSEKSESKVQPLPHENYDRSSFSPFLSSVQSDAFKYKNRTACGSMKSHGDVSMMQSHGDVRRLKDRSSNDVESRNNLTPNPGLFSAITSHKPVSAPTKLDTKHCSSRLSDHKTIVSIGGVAKLDKDEAKTDHPLDLTVKRDVVSPAKCKPSSFNPQCSGSNSSNLCTTKEHRNHEPGYDSSQLSPINQPHKSIKINSSSDPPSRKSSDAAPPHSSQSGPTKSPLQSISDNMQTLFSYMKPRIEAAIHQNSSPSSSAAISAPQKPLSEQYKPLMITSLANCNPLQEMIKIVNKTDVEKPRSANSRTSKSPESHNSRKRSSTGHQLVDSKKSKISRLLQDLVVPKDESPPSSENPLQLIQDLVDNKLHGSRSNPSSSHLNPSAIQSTSTNSLSSRTSCSPRVMCTPSEQPFADNTSTDGLTSVASALLSLQTSLPPNTHKRGVQTNGFCNSWPTATRPVNSPTSPTQETASATTRTPFDQLLLEVAFAKSRLTSSSPCEPDQTLLNRVRWSRDKVQKCFRSFDDELKSRGELSFLRFHGNGDVELVCRRCHAVFRDVIRYSDHVEQHIEKASDPRPGESPPMTSSKKETASPKEPPDGGEKVEKKYTIQGAVCFGSYLDHVTESRENGICERDGDVTSPVANNMMSLKRSRLPHRRCADEVSSSDDVIRVTS